MPTPVGNGFGSVENIFSAGKFFGPAENSPPKIRSYKYVLGGLIFLGVLALVVAGLTFIPVLTRGSLQNPISRYFFGELGKTSEVSSKKEIPRPTIGPLPKGIQSWNFSHGSEVTGPKIQTATVNTLTPKKGSTQSITLTIKNDSPVTKATATVYTDNSHNSYPLKLSKGKDTDGTWVGSWTIEDSYIYIYHIDFLLESSTGNWTGGLTF